MGMTFSSQAQKVLSIEDAVTYKNGTLIPKTLTGLAWIPETHTYYYYAKMDSVNCLVMVNADKRTRDTLTLPQLNFGLKVYNGINRKSEGPLPDFTAIPGILNWKNETTFRFVHKQLVYLFNTKERSLSIEHGLAEDVELTEYDAKTGRIAYTVGQNVFVKLVGMMPLQLSFDSTDGYVNGTAVHRNEFGIEKGLFWSNSANRLAFYHMNESMVTPYPIYDLDAMPAKGDNIRYPFAGSTSHQVEIRVYDLKSNRTITLQSGLPSEQYLTNIAWSPDDKSIYVAIVNRDQNHLRMCQFNAQTGELVQVLFEEKHDKYVEPEHAMEWIDSDHFIWQSERDGFNHLYLYKEDGTLVKQLTSGKWLVTELFGADKKGNEVYFMATRQSPLNRNLYKVNIATGEIKELGGENAYHTCMGTTDKELWLDRYSAAGIPNVIKLRGAKEAREEELFKAENPLLGYQLGETSVFTIPSRDGSTELYCRMIKPTNFDPNKKYPVVVYVYGGPHLQMIRNSWLSGADLWMNYMAQQGYVVFSLDNRGSDNRGLEFENAVFRQLGTLEMADQLAGVDYLKKQPFVDGERMAVHGWSFGGFMTTTLMTKAPGTFRVGVAGGPVIDWGMYEIMYTERYMDSPQENPEGYKTANLLNSVQNLNGKLLMIHGTSDDVVLWQHSLLYLRQCVKKEVLVDYFVYPEHPHNVRGKDRVHLMRKVTEYIKENTDE